MEVFYTLFLSTYQLIDRIDLFKVQVSLVRSSLVARFFHVAKYSHTSKPSTRVFGPFPRSTF